jgi:hypothetical protein
MDIDTLIAEAQKVVDDLTAFKAQLAAQTVAPSTVKDVIVEETDGTSETLEPAA